MGHNNNDNRHDDDEQEKQHYPKLKHIYSIRFETEDPIIIANGPAGTRAIFEFKKGSGFFSAGKDYPKDVATSAADFEGTVIGPSADWAFVAADGSPPAISLDVNMILKLNSTDGNGDDGPAIFCRIIGRSERVDGTSTSILHSAATYQTGDKRYAWLNHKLLMGKGTKEGSVLKVDYYDY